MQRLSENELIARYLAPLAQSPSARGLLDDAAWLTGDFGHGLVVTTDASVAGIHFFEDDPPGEVAYKALAVNISDLAAKGADPLAYLLTLGLTEAPSAEWMERFAAGLSEAQKAFAIDLVGGDTVTARGAWWVSITALGQPGERGMVERSTARPGDQVYVSGTLGDSALGLRLRREAEAQEWPLTADDRSFLSQRYLRPQPRLALIPALRQFASAAMDVSDGLALDLARMCSASGVSAQIEAPRLPLSAGGEKVLLANPSTLQSILSGGDDYEILCTVTPANCAGFERMAAEAGLRVTRIGLITEGDRPPVFLDGEGDAIKLPSSGYQHF